MQRSFYIDLAKQGLRMPIGTDMVLHEKPDHKARLLDGVGLGEVIVESAQRYKTPLAFPLMDLMIEKHDLLTMLDIPAGEIDSYHFAAVPDGTLETVKSKIASAPPTPRMKAGLGALRHVTQHGGGLTPVGMAIGPFSMMTKLLADPITAIYMAATGASASDDEDVKLVEDALELCLLIIERSLRQQIEAGAKAICLCEPAANKVFISPNQMDAGSDVFERLVMRPNRRIKKLLTEGDCDLIFHDCGELTDLMLKAFNDLDPAVLSLGSSRKLWEDARHVKTDTVLFGNLPTKRFYSDTEMPLEEVPRLSKQLLEHMKSTGHPFILGSECDVLSVPGCHATIAAKVQAMLARA